MTSRILVADDSITIQKIVAMAFENEDAAVEGVDNGEAAFLKLQEFKPDIVLADVDMPDLNGFELSKKIKESAEFNSTYVLLLASDFEEFDDELFRESQADDHITKPFKSEDIVRKVKGLLEGDSGDSTEEAVLEEDALEEEEEEDVLSLSEADIVPEESIVDLAEETTVDRSEDMPEEEEDVMILDLPEDLEESLVDEGLGFSEEEDETEKEISVPHTADPDAALEEPVEEAEEVYELSSAELEAEEDSMESPFEMSQAEASATETLMDDDIEENLGLGFDPEPEETLETSISETAEPEDREESLEDLVGRVEALSQKAGEIQENESQEKLFSRDAIDDVIREVNALKEYSSTLSEERNGSSGEQKPRDEPLSEVRYNSEEHADELEDTFAQITQERDTRFPGFGKSSRPSHQKQETITPEPVDLLNKLSTHSFSTSLENPMPDMKDENDSRADDRNPSQSENGLKSEGNFARVSEPDWNEDKPFSEIMGREIRKILEQSLESSIEKEIAGLSEKIVRSVEDVVRQITPGIARSIIEKEIDKIKRMDDA